MLDDALQFVSNHFGVTLVFIGVAIEGVEILPKLLFPHRHEKLDRRLELFGFVGWLILIAGLICEFGEAIHLDRQIAKANRQTVLLQQQLEMEKTRNQPITSMSAIVALRVSLNFDRKNASHFFPLMPGDGVSRLTIWTESSNGRRQIILTADTIDCPSGEPAVICLIHFHVRPRNRSNPSDEGETFGDEVVGALERIDKIQLSLGTTNTAKSIESGKIRILANSRERSISIPTQEYTNQITISLTDLEK